MRLAIFKAEVSSSEETKGPCEFDLKETLSSTQVPSVQNCLQYEHL